jgi:hypothetical protein
MAQKMNDAALRAIIDRFSRDLTQAVTQQVQEQVSLALSQMRGGASRSDGRRAGFICDQHRAELSTDEQRMARDRWNARRKGKMVAPAADQSSKAVVPVPPIVRKAEPAEA